MKDALAVLAAPRTVRILVLTLFVSLLSLAPVALIGCNGDTSAEGDGSAGSDSGAVAENAESEDGEKDDEAEKKKASREKTTTVNASKVVKGILVIPVVAEGSVRARNSTEIRAEIEGPIDRIHVKEGQSVRRGQIIATLDDRQYRVALEEARSEYLEALGRLAADEEKLDSEQATDWLKDRIGELDRLEKEGAITNRERVEKELALEVEAVKQGAYRNELVKVRSGLAAARAAQQRAELNLEDTEIRAPFSGVISNLNLTPGERVTDNQILCSLVDNKNLEAEVSVLESDLAGLERGRASILEIPALGETLHVTVDVMSPEIDAESRTCRLLMRFENQNGSIRPGMFVRASIAGEIYPDRVLVPREAILTRDNRPVLFKIKDGRALWVYIQTGLANDRLVEVTKILQGGPLDPGTEIVISDNLTLTDKAKVKIRKMQEIQFAFTAQQDQ